MVVYLFAWIRVWGRFARIRMGVLVLGVRGIAFDVLGGCLI